MQFASNLKKCHAAFILGLVVFGGGCSIVESGVNIVKGTQEIDRNTREKLEHELKMGAPLEVLPGMVDKSKVWVLGELQAIPAKFKKEPPLVLALGSVRNNTQSTQSRKIRGAMSSLLAALSQNEKFTETFELVDRTDQENWQIQEVTVGGDISIAEDPLGRSSNRIRRDTYLPDDVFLLSGELNEDLELQGNSARVTYSLILKIFHGRNMSFVAQKEYPRTMTWKSGFVGMGSKWVPEPHEE